MTNRSKLLGGNEYTNGEVLNDFDLDDTNDAIVNFAAKGQAQIPFTTLKSTGDWENEGNLAADRTTDTDGINNTINTNNTTTLYNTDKYEINDFLDAHFVVEADSLSEGAFQDNTCIIKKISDTQWIVYSETGTFEERRANLIKTLFYGTNGNNAAILTVTNLVSLKTNISRDIGKRAYYLEGFIYAGQGDNETTIEITGTFNNTTDNLNCSSWAYSQSRNQDPNPTGGGTTTLEIPQGNTLYTGSNYDEFGEDNSNLEQDNPTDYKLTIYNDDNGSNPDDVDSRALILCEGTITINVSESGESTNTGTDSIDFTTDENVPVIEESTFDPQVLIIDSNTLKLSGNEKTISLYNPSLIPTDTSIKATLNDGTQDISDETTLSENDATVIPLTATPTAGNTLEIHYSLETTDSAKTPEWYGYGVYKY